MYVLTIKHAGIPERGVFASVWGHFVHLEDRPHTVDEMWDILGPFALVLEPESTFISDDELVEYSCFIPLDEYKRRYGVVLRPDQFERIREANDAATNL